MGNKKAIALNKNISKEVLEGLSRDSNDWVRKAVASNKNSSKD